MDIKDEMLDDKVKSSLQNFHDSIEKINRILETSLSTFSYDKLSTKEKVDLDLFMAYTLNSLYWLYLKTRGEDPSQHEVKNQLNRIRQYLVKAKDQVDSQNKPRIDKAAAGRFIKHGIGHHNESEPPPNKKIKFSED